MFKVQEENNDLNHQMIVLGIKKKESRRRQASTSRTSRRTSEDTPRKQSTPLPRA